MTEETTEVGANTEVAGRAEFALLDCPLCGGKVDWCGNHAKSECDGCHWIECSNCGLFDLHYHSGDAANELNTLREYCADKWNKRAI